MEREDAGKLLLPLDPLQIAPVSGKSGPLISRLTLRRPHLGVGSPGSVAEDMADTPTSEISSATAPTGPTGSLLPRSRTFGRNALSSTEPGIIPDSDAVIPSGVNEFALLPEHVQRRLAGVLRMQLLGNVRDRVEAGHLDFINELRPLTCLFVGFPTLLQQRDDTTHEDQVSDVQYCVQSVQSIMRKWDGSFLQFRCDEKGYLSICAFGLPGHTHEDDPSRAILAALDLQKTIEERGHRVCVGVTTGDLLCTCVGGRKLRNEYTVFGDAINLSARLMVKCKKSECWH